MVGLDLCIIELWLLIEKTHVMGSKQVLYVVQRLVGGIVFQVRRGSGNLGPLPLRPPRSTEDIASIQLSWANSPTREELRVPKIAHFLLPRS